MTIDPTGTAPDPSAAPGSTTADTSVSTPVAQVETVHAAQGLTVDAADLPVGDGPDTPALYVAMTRGRADDATDQAAAEDVYDAVPFPEDPDTGHDRERWALQDELGRDIWDVRAGDLTREQFDRVSAWRAADTRLGVERAAAEDAAAEAELDDDGAAGW